MAEELIRLSTRLDEMDKRLAELRTDINQRFSDLRTSAPSRLKRWIGDPKH